MEDVDHVTPQDPLLKNSPTRAKEQYRVDVAGLGHASCHWNGNEYSDGATICDNHTRYECWNGRWAEIGLC
jgi:hypothetical protein